MSEIPYKNALITGASSGMGRGLAAWFAARGVKVYACARREDQLAALAKEVGGVEPMAMDVRDTGATVKAIREIDAACGGLDLIIANAGVGSDRTQSRYSWESVERLLDVNVMGAAATLTAVLPRMIERKRGHLVGIASAAAYRGIPKMAPYSGSKAFLGTFLEGLRVDLQGSGVHFTRIHPGFVKSELTAKATGLPFLLDTDVAVEKIGKAVLRKDTEFVFPWQISAVFHVLKVMPNAVYDVAAKRLG